MVQYNYKSRTLAALDTNTLSRNTPDISLQQVHNRVRSIGDCINSPPGPRRIPRVKKALAEFEDTGILIRNGNHFRLTPSLQTVLDEARLRHKVPVNAAPRRQMQLYRKILNELSEREDVDLEGLTPEKVTSLSRSKMQSLLKQAGQQLKLARKLPSSSASGHDRPFVSETDIGTVFGTPNGFASDDDSGESCDSMDMDMGIDMSAESQPIPLVIRQPSYMPLLPPSPHTQFDTSDPDDVTTTVIARYDSKLTPTKPSCHPTGILTPPDTLHVDRIAYNHLTEELNTKKTGLAQAQEDLAKEREDARIKLREQGELHTRALEDKDAEVKANNERIATLEERLASLQEKFDEIKYQNQLLDGQSTHDCARILELEGQMSVLRAEYNEIFTNLTTANTTIPALHEELDTQRATVAKLRATIDDLTHQCQVLEDKNKSQSEVIARRKKHSLDLVNMLTQSLTNIDLPLELTQ